MKFDRGDGIPLRLRSADEVDVLVEVFYDLGRYKRGRFGQADLHEGEILSSGVQCIVDLETGIAHFLETDTVDLAGKIAQI